MHNTTSTWNDIAAIQEIDPDADLVIGMKLYVGTESTAQIDIPITELKNEVANNYADYEDGLNSWNPYHVGETEGLFLGLFNPRGGKYDLKALKGSDARSCTFGVCVTKTDPVGHRKNWAYAYGGKLIRYDAPGGILLGYAAAFFGFSPANTAIHTHGAQVGINLYNKLTGKEWGKYWFDDPYDQQMIWKGYCSWVYCR